MIHQLITEGFTKVCIWKNDRLVKQDEAEIALLGLKRYETVRKMNPQQFTALKQRNIKEGIPFDELVDQEFENREWSK